VEDVSQCPGVYTLDASSILLCYCDYQVFPYVVVAKCSLEHKTTLVEDLWYRGFFLFEKEIIPIEEGRLNVNAQ
jgi:hypothetical protein